MSDMIEVKTAELIGPALNWAVAVVVDYKTALESGDQGPDEWIVIGREDMYLTRDPNNFHVWSPSTDWSQGGPLRDKYQVAVYEVENGRVAATLREHPEHWIDESEFDAGATAETALVAICRAIVASKLGDIVKVPACLVTL